MMYTPSCHIMLKHTSTVMCLLVASYRHSEGCSVPTSTFPLGSQIGADVPGKQP